MRIAVPSKGRLREPVLRLLEAAGIEPQYSPDSARALIVPTNWEDVTLVYVRPEDIPAVVSAGGAELGVTGLDYIAEHGGEGLEVVEGLGIGRARLVVAVPDEAPVERVEDLPDGVRVATKFVNIARRFFEESGVRARIVRITGSAEAMPRLGVADAILDVSSTGTTLRLHRLRVIAEVMKTEAKLIRGHHVDPGDPVVEAVVEALRSVVRARGYKLVLMNVPVEALERVLEALPSMSGPTLARVEGPRPMMEVVTVVPEDRLARVLVEARRRGARDILVLSVDRVIP
ncbi:ATP phosphoribosyltransferase [Pyrodictium occultum]|uniref:ATP phosphoribosyltransferase n=1 Tax=Pyrodictium occultum TaxID=2309 RepID=A0A0V8RX68_PYROC|nr:ATP phosphoribosyltransferase [Pyrodictium occultum]